jgi:glycosyltransferase involved in cell wall biosynthesis
MHILVFAYVFPPDAGSGTYRTLYFANEWARLGDDVTIVTVKEDCFLTTALVDRGLCKEVRPSIRVVRASAMRPLQRLLELRSAFRRKKSKILETDPGKGTELDSSRRAHGILRQFKDTITDLLSCPDEHIGWAPDAVRRGYGITKATRVDCIYATGGPWSGLLAATVLHKLCGIPLVLDFRDPWATNPNLSAKSRLSRSLQARMESVCVRSARMVIANTEELRQDFTRRYARMDSNRFATVTNGFEQIPGKDIGSNDRLTLVHAGELYLSRNPLNFLRAVVDLVNRGTIPVNKLKIQLVGGIEINDAAMESELSSGVLRSVLEIKPRVSHDEVLSIQQSASALLLIQPGFPLQVPRKLYEYLSLARPILAIAEPRSATARMVNELGAGYVADDSVDAIKTAIVELYRAWESGAMPTVVENKLLAYSNRYLSSKLRNIMLSCAI